MNYAPPHPALRGFPAAFGFADDAFPFAVSANSWATSTSFRAFAFVVICVFCPTPCMGTSQYPIYVLQPVMNGLLATSRGDFYISGYSL